MLDSNENLSFLIGSSQNIDSIVSAYRACKKANKIFVVDIYTAWILEVVSQKSKVPNISWDDVKVIKKFGGRYYEKIKTDREHFGDFVNRVFDDVVSLKELENKIFEEWNDKFIVKDGIVDFNSFAIANAKVLILLKETNDYVNNEQDLRVFLKQGGRSTTWNNIVRWVYGLQNIEKNIDELWGDISDVSNDKRKEILSTISSINLKKKPGGATTVKKELEEETKKNLDFLKKQIQLYVDYETDFVICGGTSYLVKEHKIFGDMDFLTHKSTGTEIGQYNKTIVISYYHPQVRGQGSAKDVLFKNLICAVKDFKFNKDNTFS